MSKERIPNALDLGEPERTDYASVEEWVKAWARWDRLRDEAGRAWPRFYPGAFQWIVAWATVAAIAWVLVEQRGHSIYNRPFYSRLAVLIAGAGALLFWQASRWRLPRRWAKRGRTRV